MSTFVLVHGAWQTAATWDLLAPMLRDRGHGVITPLLTGLGTHPEPLTPEVSLSRHIADVVLAVKSAAPPVMLVGHSYAGMIISGVADQVEVDSLAYLDAFVPADGRCALDLLPASVGNHFRQLAAQVGDGWRLPGSEAQLDLWGLPTGPARNFVQARLCDFTLRCFEEPVSLSQDRKLQLPSRYISCVGSHYPAKPFFLPFAEEARANSWPVFEIDCGHVCHVENPAAVAEILVGNYPCR
ncbi:MAG: alpha/beta hydrolase [Bryobacteraceae bacterium]|nr:alpha/beta hydrolase [Bryobacteraceae bacterium]